MSFVRRPYAGLSSILAKRFEPLRRKLRVAHRVLNILGYYGITATLAVLRRRLLQSPNPPGRPHRAVAVKRLQRSFTSFRPLRDDCAVAIGRWVSRASTPQTGAPRRVRASKPWKPAAWSARSGQASPKATRASALGLDGEHGSGSRPATEYAGNTSICAQRHSRGGYYRYLLIRLVVYSVSRPDLPPTRSPKRGAKWRLAL